MDAHDIGGCKGFMDLQDPETLDRNMYRVLVLPTRSKRLGVTRRHSRVVFKSAAQQIGCS